MKYSVTGTAHYTVKVGRLAAIRQLRNAYEPLRDVTEFTTGAAPAGVDVDAFYMACEYFPDAHHRVCVPIDCRHAEVVVGDARDCGFEVIAVRGASPEGYMRRNDLLVAHAHVLLAFPRTATEELRSGTWATIRRARRAHVPVRTFPLVDDASR